MSEGNGRSTDRTGSDGAGNGASGAGATNRTSAGGEGSVDQTMTHQRTTTAWPRVWDNPLLTRRASVSSAPPGA